MVHNNHISKQMSLEQYLKEVELQFEREVVDPPERLNPAYFTPQGFPTAILESYFESIKKYMVEIGCNLTGVYLGGSQANGKFHEKSDVDLLVQIEPTRINESSLPNRLMEIETRMVMYMIVEGISAKVEQQMAVSYKVDSTFNFAVIRECLVNYPDTRLRIVKPYGVVYDLSAKEWVTFGKTEDEYNSFRGICQVFSEKCLCRIYS